MSNDGEIDTEELFEAIGGVEHGFVLACEELHRALQERRTKVRSVRCFLCEDGWTAILFANYDDDDNPARASFRLPRHIDGDGDFPHGTYSALAVELITTADAVLPLLH